MEPTFATSTGTTGMLVTWQVVTPSYSMINIPFTITSCPRRATLIASSPGPLP
jgi:hypothetical protein